MIEIVEDKNNETEIDKPKSVYQDEDEDMLQKQQR